MPSHLSLILGGARSGKSSYGETCAREQNRPVVYIATCRTQNLDTEMQARIYRHQSDRPAQWITVENQFDLPALFEKYPDHLFLLDCLTLWLGHQHEVLKEEAAILAELERSWKALRQTHSHAIVISNELGLGVVPEYPDVRAFRDLSGRANQLTARHADETTFMLAGLPWELKPKH